MFIYHCFQVVEALFCFKLKEMVDLHVLTLVKDVGQHQNNWWLCQAIQSDTLRDAVFNFRQLFEQPFRLFPIFLRGVILRQAV